MFARTTRILLGLASIAAIVAFLVLAVLRLGNAHPVDPSESALLEHAERLAGGQALYRAPSTPFAIPLMPGMPLLVSGLVKLYGPELWEPRLLTLLPALALGWMVFAIVSAETKRPFLGLASAGILLAGLAVSTLRAGPATPEPLALALGLGGICLLRFTNSYVGVVLAAVSLSAAFFVHPLALLFLFAGVAYLLHSNRAHCLTFVLGAAVLCGGLYVLLSMRLGAWFNFNAWDGPIANLQFRPLHLLHTVGDELLGRLGVLTLSAVLAFALPTRPWRGLTGIWMWSALAAVVFALVSTQTLRISPRDVMPALACLVIVGPISAQRVTQHLSAWPGSSRLGGEGVVLVALTLQYVMLLAGATAALMPPVV